MHWNFFATIAVVNIAVVFVRQVKHSLLLAFVIAMAYEFALDTYNLKGFIYYAPRDNLF